MNRKGKIDDFLLIFALTIPFCTGFNEVNEGCYFDTFSKSKTSESCYDFILIYLNFSVGDPTFSTSVGLLSPDATPYHCYLGCLMQDFLQVGRPITIGLTSGNICLCGYEPSKCHAYLMRGDFL